MDFAAVERELADFAREVLFAAVVFAAAGREPEERAVVAVALRVAAGLRAAGLRAAGLRAAGLRAAALVLGAALGASVRLTSSAETRLARPSTSVRMPLSSETTRSSSTSRILLAATAISPESCCAAPPAPVNVRSTAVRTASTASTAPPAAWSFLPPFLSFLSFFAMASRS